MFETARDRDVTKTMVDETIADELNLSDVLVVTDVPELQHHVEPGGALVSARGACRSSD